MQSDDGLFINMFAGGEYKTTALGGFKKLDIHTKFPFDGKSPYQYQIFLMQS